MGDEDDDLLRAAEELGIDLSGVRAGEAAGADEQVEGEDDTDAVTADDDEDTEADVDVDIDADVNIADLPQE